MELAAASVSSLFDAGWVILVFLYAKKGTPSVSGLRMYAEPLPVRSK